MLSFQLLAFGSADLYLDSQSYFSEQGVCLQASVMLFLLDLYSSIAQLYSAKRCYSHYEKRKGITSLTHL